MSQSLRRVLAVTGLAAALLLSVPAPSRAAGLRGQGPDAGFVTRTWSWLEGLLGISAPAASARQATLQRKDTAVVMPIVPPPSTTGQGSMIDPDGRTGH
jgi:hypothetical protein